MKKIIAIILCVCICFSLLVGCTGEVVQNNSSPFDENGRLIAVRGTPKATDKIDRAWGNAVTAALTKGNGQVKATVKPVWDDTNLYILVEVTDSMVTDSDSVTAYVDTLWDRAAGYDDTDIKSKITVEDGVITTDSGYAALFTFDIADTLTDGWIMGFEVKVDDYNADGSYAGSVYLFDDTGACDEDTAYLGDMIISGKREVEISPNKSGLEKLSSQMGTRDYSAYGANETIQPAIDKLNEVYADTNATVEDIVMVMENAHKTVYNLVDVSAFPQVNDIAVNTVYIDPFEFLDGRKMSSIDEWETRRKEISDMYQYYMYGVWRDGSDEEVTYDYANGTLTVKIKRISTGKETQFTATVMVPDKSVKAPSNAGYPVVVGMHAGISEETALKNGFATITIDWFSYGVASDDTKHTGAFYDLYPYGTDWQDQTGVLMAWGWGCSKILDALEAGLGEELNIDAANSIVTGVSRWGKAASVAGAYEPRFKMVAPSCSGAGGLAAFRYVSKGKTYDFSTKGESAFYTYGDNEPLGSLQSSGEVGWFCNNFKKFKSAAQLPFEQYELASLVADPDRYLFIIGSCVWEDWVNAPAMWYTYLGAKEIYNALGISDNIKINIHTSGHAVIEEDMNYMTQYFKQMVYGIEPTDDLSVLDTSVFAEERNVDYSMNGFIDGWTKFE